MRSLSIPWMIDDFKMHSNDQKGVQYNSGNRNGSGEAWPAWLSNDVAKTKSRS